MTDERRFYLPHEAAKRLRCNPRTLNRWARAGNFPYILTPGGHMRLDADFIDKVARGEIRFRMKHELTHTTP